MLDTVTKRRIDNARDILVGKVPDPKSQVEQITIALIYKFMDDMDAEAEELGGKRKFFTGDFARYGWAKLMSAGIGGHELIGLYGEGITTMPQNPGIPPLFRDIFKNAYLPYRDPETLKSFLKIIDEFSYDHSERLGDAYEYLLSVLGSQGDAGQFRTPRHIIDFMVKVMDPKKHETITDTSCGTAGFLISAYKHILKHNSKDYKPKPDHQADVKNDVPLELLTLESPLHYKGDLLTPDERKRLAGNIKGYDISPDMVRMSLVNLYLHGFNDPHIFEYDTLTSEERWDEYSDVIFANPPFMSPKGGIKPHKRFSIQAKRSEVLFVDYIAEHLTPAGRAGIIVPEGIIFQSQTAYKALRKMLVDNSLVAVISLPAGVFQPYSGVKTSILILDKSRAKQSDSIAFFKVENDGFGLGAQRRAIEKNDLPDVEKALKEYFHMDIQGGQDKNEKSCSSILETLSSKGTALIVPKEKIAMNGDYNLSGERYRENVANTRLEWPLVPIGELCIVERGASPRPIHDFITDNPDGINWIKIGDAEVGSKYITSTKERVNPEGAAKSRRVKPGDFILSNSMSFGRPYIMAIDGCIHDGWLLLRDQSSLLDQDFLYNILGSKLVYSQFKQAATGGVVNNLNSEIVRGVQIPLPPLEVQKEIVAEIECYQKVINGARAVLDNYRPHIPINPDWPMVELGVLCNIEHGFAFKGEFFVQDGLDDLPILLTPGNFMQGGGLYFTSKNTKKYSGDFPDAFRLKRGDLVVVMTDLSPMMKILGMPAIIDNDQFLHNQRIGKVVLKSDQVLKSFLRYAFLLEGVNGRIKREATGSTVRHTSPSRILSVEIPLPNLEIQQHIVAEIEAEQALVAANRELISRFEKKIQATLARVWGMDGSDEGLSFS